MFTKPFKSHTRSKPELFKGIFYTMPGWNFLLKERNTILRLEKKFFLYWFPRRKFWVKMKCAFNFDAAECHQISRYWFKIPTLEIGIDSWKANSPRYLAETVVSTSWYCHRSISSVQLSSVAQSCPTLQPRGLQHIRLPCLSATSRVCSNSCTSSQWCHPATSSSVIPFCSCLQSFPASGSSLRS